MNKLDVWKRKMAKEERRRKERQEMWDSTMKKHGEELREVMNRRGL